MKIAFYHRNVNGGIRTHVDALTYEFEKLGHEVKRIDQFSLGSYMLGNSTGGISYGFDFALKKIKKEVTDCDILHIHHSATFSEYFLPFSSICSDVNVVNTFHIQAGDGLGGEAAKTLIAMLVTLYTGRSKRFISVSAEIAEYIRQQCFGYIKDWVEKKIRRHLMRARKRHGFGWNRWSRAWFYETLGLFNDYGVRHYKA